MFDQPKKEYMKNATEIAFVMDKSGSMSVVRDETIKGFNRFLGDQQKVAGECRITLMQFDTTYHMVHSGADISKVQPLTEATYCPGGYTALLDAIGKTIVETGARLEKLPEHERPDKVVVVIATDGQENSSREFTRARVMQMIEAQKKTYNWHFIFLGANQDGIQGGSAIGVAAGMSVSVASNDAGTRAAYSAISSNMVDYRTSGDAQRLAFSKRQREEQKKHGATSDSQNS